VGRLPPGSPSQSASRDPTSLARTQVDRKQVPADWVRKLQAVQATAAQDAKEVPAGLLPQQPDGERTASRVARRWRLLLPAQRPQCGSCVAPTGAPWHPAQARETALQSTTLPRSTSWRSSRGPPRRACWAATRAKLASGTRSSGRTRPTVSA
jgi:hypothetical protein